MDAWMDRWLVLAGWPRAAGPGETSRATGSYAALVVLQLPVLQLPVLCCRWVIISIMHIKNLFGYSYGIGGCNIMSYHRAKYLILKAKFLASLWTHQNSWCASTMVHPRVGCSRRPYKVCHLNMAKASSKSPYMQGYLVTWVFVQASINAFSRKVHQFKRAPWIQNSSMDMVSNVQSPLFNFLILSST